jgi:hypothetical protein
VASEDGSELGRAVEEIRQFGHLASLVYIIPNECEIFREPHVGNATKY